MTENIIKFPGPRETRETVSPSVSDRKGATPDKKPGSQNVEIPSMSALYDEDRITVVGKPLSKLRQLIPVSTDIEPSIIEEQIETALLNARHNFIIQNAPGFQQKREEIKRLAEYTWSRAVEMNSQELKDRVTDSLSHVFGVGQVGRILERLSLVSRLLKAKQTLGNPEPDLTPPQILPFRRRQ